MGALADESTRRLPLARHPFGSILRAVWLDYNPPAGCLRDCTIRKEHSRLRWKLWPTRPGSQPLSRWMAQSIPIRRTDRDRKRRVSRRDRSSRCLAENCNGGSPIEPADKGGYPPARLPHPGPRRTIRSRHGSGNRCSRCGDDVVRATASSNTCASRSLESAM